MVSYRYQLIICVHCNLVLDQMKHDKALLQMAPAIVPSCMCVLAAIIIVHLARDAFLNACVNEGFSPKSCRRTAKPFSAILAVLPSPVELKPQYPLSTFLPQHELSTWFVFHPQSSVPGVLRCGSARCLLIAINDLI